MASISIRCHCAQAGNVPNRSSATPETIFGNHNEPDFCFGTANDLMGVYINRSKPRLALNNITVGYVSKRRCAQWAGTACYLLHLLNGDS